MQVIEKRISELVPYDNNPRKNERAVPFVVNSIKTFGFRVPIVIDAHNVIIAGHTRVLACKQLGMTTVPCIIADDMTPEQVRAFRLIDNKTAEASEWDVDKLDAELASLAKCFDFDDFGFADAIPIAWEDVPELTESSYEEPKEARLQCPHCHHIAGKAFFKRVS